MHHGIAVDIALLLTGVLAGAASAAFGIGGAVITTPMIRLFGETAFLAVATPLPSILPTAAAGALRYHKRDLIVWQIVMRVGPPGAIGAALASLAPRRLPGDGHPLMILTAMLLGWTAWRTLNAGDGRPNVEIGTPGNNAAVTSPVARIRLYVIGFAVGALAGLLGIGGGALLVPALRRKVGLPIKQAVATSLACVAVFTLPAITVHAIERDIDWPIALLLCGGVIPGARIGSNLAMRASDPGLQRAVGRFFIVLAIIYGVTETYQWVH